MPPQHFGSIRDSHHHRQNNYTSKNDERTTSSPSVVLDLDGLLFQMPRVSNALSYDYSSISSRGSISSCSRGGGGGGPSRRVEVSPLVVRRRRTTISSLQDQQQHQQQQQRPPSPLYFQMEFLATAEEAHRITRLHRVLSKLSFWNTQSLVHTKPPRNTTTAPLPQPRRSFRRSTPRRKRSSKQRTSKQQQQQQLIEVVPPHSPPLPFLSLSPNSSGKNNNNNNKLPPRPLNHTFSNTTTTTHSSTDSSSGGGGGGTVGWSHSSSHTSSNTSSSHRAGRRGGRRPEEEEEEEEEDSIHLLAPPHPATSSYEPIVSASAEWYDTDDDDHVVLLSAQDNNHQWEPDQAQQDSEEQGNLEAIWYPKWRMLDESLPEETPSILILEEEEDDDEQEDDQEQPISQDPKEQHRIMHDLEILSEAFTSKNSTTNHQDDHPPHSLQWVDEEDGAGVLVAPTGATCPTSSPDTTSSRTTLQKDWSVWLSVRKRWKNTVQGVFSSSSKKTMPQDKDPQHQGGASRDKRPTTQSGTRKTSLRVPRRDRKKQPQQQHEETTERQEHDKEGPGMAPTLTTQELDAPSSRTLLLDDHYNQVVVAAHERRSSFSSLPSIEETVDDTKIGLSPTSKTVVSSVVVSPPTHHTRSSSSSGNSFRSTLMRLNCSRDEQGKESLEMHWPLFDLDDDEDEEEEEIEKVSPAEKRQVPTESTTTDPPSSTDFGELNALSSSLVTSHSLECSALAVTVDPQDHCAQLVMVPSTEDTNASNHQTTTPPAHASQITDSIALAPSPSCMSDAVLSGLGLDRVVSFPFSVSKFNTMESTDQINLEEIGSNDNPDQSPAQDKENEKNSTDTAAKNKGTKGGCETNNDRNKSTLRSALHVRSSSGTAREPDGRYHRVESPAFPLQNANSSKREEDIPLSPPKRPSGIQRLYDFALDAAAAAASATTGRRDESLPGNETPVARARRLAFMPSEQQQTTAQKQTSNPVQAQQARLSTSFSTLDSLLWTEQSGPTFSPVPVNVPFDEPPSQERDPLSEREIRITSPNVRAHTQSKDAHQQRGLFDMVNTRVLEPIMNYTLNEDIPHMCGPPPTSSNHEKHPTSTSPSSSLSMSPLARHPAPISKAATASPYRNGSHFRSARMNGMPEATSYERPPPPAYACYPFGGDNDSSTYNTSLYETPQRPKQYSQNQYSSHHYVPSSTPSSGTTTRVSSLTSIP